MKKKSLSRKIKVDQVKSLTHNVVTAILQAYWAVMTNWAAWFVTHLIHAKGAPLKG